MNREILFRGFCADPGGGEKVFVNGEWKHGEWVCGDLIHNYDGRYFIGELVIDDYKGSACDEYTIGYCIYDVIPETVGQYTEDQNCRR